MKLRYWIISLLILVSMMAVSAVERQLGGIRLGMRPKDVMDHLGDPTAILMAQPPLAGPPTPADIMPRAGVAFPGAPPMAAPAEPDNTLVFLYKDMEVELGPNTGIASGSEPSPDALPVWAYTVRVAKLALDQQELIYRINDTYSLGITITGQGNEARVTDIIACSLKPLTFWPNNPNREFDRKDAFFKDIFTYKYASGPKKELPAGTSKKIAIGSRLDEVLKAHKWPAFFIPFVTENQATVVFDPKKPLPQVVGASGASAQGGNADFALDATERLSAAFAPNCMLLYPDDGLALTLLNFTVVRIQIGKEMSKPTLETPYPTEKPALPAVPK